MICMEKETISLTPPEYRIAMLKEQSDTILSRSDALRIRGYGNWDFNDCVTVYSNKQLDNPFKCDIVDDLNTIEYSVEHGIPICSERQAFVDMLNDPRGETQTLIEALGDYYYTHNKSFDSLNLGRNQIKILNKYKNDAINYWS